MRVLPPRTLFSIPKEAVPEDAFRTTARVGDVTGDGRPDVVTLVPETASAFVVVQEADGRFRVGPRLPVSPLAYAVAVADVDGDGRVEPVLLRTDGPQLLRVTASGGLEPGPAPATGGPVLGADIRTTFARIDGGNRSALLAITGGTLIAYRLEGSGVFRASPIRAMPVGLGPLVTGDFDGDGNVDLLAPSSLLDFSTVTATPIPSPLLLGDGRGGFPRVLDVSVPYQSRTVVGDFNGDGLDDVVSLGVKLVETPPPSHHVVVSELLLGDRTLGLVSPSTGAELRLEASENDGLLVADLDQDGRDDLLVKGFYTSIWKALPTGGFAKSAVFPWSTPASGITGRDDAGRLELLSASGREVQVTYLSCSPTFSDRTVPAVVSVTGIDGARYETELTLDNTGDQDMILELRYTSSFGGGDGSATVTLPARRQRDLRPALGSLAALGIPIPPGGDRGGTLAIRILTPSLYHLVVRARVVSRTAGGHAGVGFEDVPFVRGHSDETLVAWLRETGGDRSNLALINLAGAGEGDVTVRPVIVATDTVPSRSIPLPDITLAPGQVVQLDRVLRAAGATSGYARVRRVSGTAPFFAYGVVNDEGTSDGSFVAGFEPSRAPRSWPASRAFPAVVESGRYRSDLIVTNTSSAARSLSFRFVSETVTTPDRTARFTLDVPPYGQLFLPDLVDHLRRTGVAGIGPRGDEYVGALFAELGTPADGLFMGARVSADAAEGRYGVFYEALDESALPYRSAVFVSGIRQDDEVRTNLAIVNAEDRSATFTIRAFDTGAGGFAGEPLTVTLGPRRWTQIDSALLALHTSLTSGRLYVTAAGTEVRKFIVYGITNDGSRPGSGTADPTYLPMTTAGLFLEQPLSMTACDPGAPRPEEQPR